MAKYPFSDEAREHIQKLNIEFGNIHDELDYALNRVRLLLDGEMKGNSRESLSEADIISFPLAKIIVSLAEDPYLLRQYARAESRRAENLLSADTGENLERLASSFIGYEKKGGFYVIGLAEYLNAIPENEESKLVNQKTEGGKVYLTPGALIGLVAEKLYRSILETRAKKKDFPRHFLAASGELREYKRTIEEIKGPVEFAAFPPCMRKIYQDLQTQPNVGHNARFVFSTFLGNINMGIEKALALFSKQENFNEKIARYHLEHAYGIRSGTKYSVPSCQKMAAYGLCYKDSTCKWPSPIFYYKNVSARQRRNAGN